MKTMLATSTPELDRRAEEYHKREQKRREKLARENKKTVKRKLLDSANSKGKSSSSMNEEYTSDTDDVMSLDSDDSEGENGLSVGELLDNPEDISVEKFVLVQFEGNSNKQLIYYIGKVLSNMDEDGDYEVEFLRRGRKNNTTFVRPATEDIASVAKQNIRAVLPNPLRGTTQRTKGVFSFPVDFGKLDLR